MWHMHLTFIVLCTKGPRVERESEGEAQGCVGSCQFCVLQT